jgi:glycosyltransferase involved in cell wall biosynthesis
MERACFPSVVRGDKVTSPRLMFVVTEDWYFVSHRLALAVAARDAGYDVSVVTRVRAHRAQIAAAGIRIFDWEHERGGLNPFAELRSLRHLVRTYRRERPHLVHHVALKPALLGSVAARLARVPRVINAVAGMGWLYSSSAGLAKALRPVFQRALALLFRHPTVFVLVQNLDDEHVFVNLGVPAERARLIPGSGVDITLFTPHADAEGVPLVVLPARMLYDKGVGELVEAARLLRVRGVSLRVLLAGEPDLQNRAAIPADVIAGWVREGVVEYAGFVRDMPGLLAAAQIVCLPSYREGLPKALLEASAAGRAIVTTDVPGCREVVTDGENGLLVPSRNGIAVANALERLLTDRTLRLRMGRAGRERAEREWAAPVVISRMLQYYADTLR